MSSFRCCFARRPLAGKEREYGQERERHLRKIVVLGKIY